MNTQHTIRPGENIIFYDGVCGLCNKLIQFVLAYGGSSKFLFCALQSNVAAQLLAKYGANNIDLNTVFVITDYDLSSSKLLKKSQAIFFILQHCDLPWYTPWAYLSLFRFLPQFLLDFGYDFIASIRYNVFGHYDSCLVPEQNVRDRFIDQ